jgi:hypothetical protein
LKGNSTADSEIKTVKEGEYKAETAIEGSFYVVSEILLLKVGLGVGLSLTA